MKRMLMGVGGPHAPLISYPEVTLTSQPDFLHSHVNKIYEYKEPQSLTDYI